jgi:hypothetical protein
MSTTTGRSGQTRGGSDDLVPREYLRIIAVWSVIPAYTLAAGVLGYFADRWLGTWPIIFSLALLIALALAVRDMLRLRKEM